MAAKVHVRANKAGTLFFDFCYRGIRCREFTKLKDTKENRRRCERKAQLIAAEIGAGEFDYARHFPNGTKLPFFSSRPDGRITVAEFAETIWFPHLATRLRATTLEDRRRIFKSRIAPFWGSLSLRDITPTHVDRFINELKAMKGVQGRTMSPARINIILTQLRSLLTLAYEREYIAKDAKRWVTFQRETRRPIDVFTFEEKAQFLKALPPKWQPYFIVALDTGMRPSEQLALKWTPTDPHDSYVDFDQGLLFIRSGVVRGQRSELKTAGSSRAIPMLPTVEKALRAQRLITGQHEYVFCTSEGTPHNLSNIRNRVWYPTLKKAGLRPRDLYTTRHTFATLMLRSGENPLWVSRIMGHTNTRMVFERYSTYIPYPGRRDGSSYLEQAIGFGLGV